MKRRRWLFAAIVLFAVLALLDTGAWLFATGALRSALLDWAQRQRARGIDVSVGEPVAGGWPLAATQHVDARLGPAGLPAGLVVRVTASTGLWLVHPQTVRSAVEQVRVAASSGATLTAAAARWTVDVRLDEPDRARMAATDLRLAWSGHRASVASVAGEEVSGPTAIPFTFQASEIGLGESGLVLPAGLGPIVRSLEVAGVLQGGLPPAAASADLSAQAWRQAGGDLEAERLAVSYGPFDASLKGRLGLDEALRPAGSGVLTARGVSPLLEAMGASGAIPPGAGQAAAGILALLGGGEGAVDLPFAIADGRLALAGFPVARLPSPFQPPQTGSTPKEQ